MLQRLLNNIWTWLAIGFVWFFFIAPPLVTAASDAAVAAALFVSAAWAVFVFVRFNPLIKKKIDPLVKKVFGL